MHDWNFTPDHPISLTIAADAKLGTTDYTNDHIWELNLGNSEPPSISLQTTFGLRARICRIFPRFILDGKVINNPADFYRPVTIHKYFPNYLSISFKPFSSINVKLEYWVPESHAIACRTTLTNTSHIQCSIQLDWAELLVPSEEGNRMAATEIEMTTILAGRTENLAPVFFLMGGAHAGKSPYSSLNLSYKIPPLGRQEVYWSQGTLEDFNTSYGLAKNIINKNWSAEFALISRINSQQIDILTGNHDWNVAFCLAQTIAGQLLMQPTPSCKSASFVYSRNPDQGFSLRKDGSDYNYLWNGLTIIDTYYLNNFLLPASSGLLKGLIDNFLASQNPEGEIDWKPGLGGQRSKLLATPLLANMVCQLYEYTHDIEYLKKVYPKLLEFFFSWFTTAHDRDNDLFPEWDQIIQTGFDEHPLFSISYPWSLGREISTVESPDLISYLYRECKALIFIGKQIANLDLINKLEGIADNLKTMADQSWSDQEACYFYRDRDSHYSPHEEFLGKLERAGVIEIHKEFEQPIRPVIHLKSKKGQSILLNIYIYGTSVNNDHRVEHIQTNQFHWHFGSGYYTSEYIYKTIEKIEASGIQDYNELIAQSPSLKCFDQSSLIPLWAGIPSEDKVKILVNLTVMDKNKFLSQFGLRSFIYSSGSQEIPDELFGIHLLWMNFILEGMLQYGEQKKAAEIFTRTMKAIIQSFKVKVAFNQSYNSETGEGIEAINTLTSLVPIGLFLKILGVKIISPTKVKITGSNPFPWPVTIKYKGMTVTQQEKKAMVIFPNGQSITVENNKPQIISSEKVSQ